MQHVIRYRMISDPSSGFAGMRRYLCVFEQYLPVFEGIRRYDGIYVGICWYVCIRRYVPAPPRRRRQARLVPPVWPPPPSPPPLDGHGRLHLGLSGDGSLCHWNQSQSHRFLEGAPPAADHSSPPLSPQGGDRRTIHWTWDGPHSDRTLSGHFLPWPLDVCES